MKTLTIKEPFATLINNEIKHIETRSWKTNYRGYLYIHAGISPLSDKVKQRNELSKLYDEDNLNYGSIICKCKLVDCIYMTEEYINYIKENNYQEYICGEYKVGRYAWVLDDIEPLDEKIKVKGNLGLWNFYDEFEIMDLMNNIQYGWLDKYNNKHNIVDETYSDNYILEYPTEVIKNKVGVCWDQVELERYYFKYKTKTYFIVHYENECPTHTFLIFEKNNKYYWFEHSWKVFRGIHEYKYLDELLIDIKNKFIKYELNNKYDINKLKIFEYKKPKYNINVQDFYSHCENGIEIDL